ncbi:exopolyphosphatase [Marinicella rhabdoformis]|uniref:exopolyphosphatase n=1 Tax=Marinicella rhabdoformis TaxID=2580566 RepID=UPI0012AED48E|nr:exopolyphosphatase [Marinicella rhabdoformis]
MSIQPKDTFAAIDLGSNSFHLLVATFKSGQLQQIDKVKQMVRLAANLDHKKRITQAGLVSAFECLSMFAQRIKHIPSENIKIVGTNTLRVAKNAEHFLQQAEDILNHDIDIISGREEARLLYLGVAQSMSEHLSNKLVMDIGGGSTEIITGKGFESKQRESLHMGCVSYTKRFFSDGKITQTQWSDAYTHALQELSPVSKSFKKIGWEHAIGASGTMRAAAKILVANDWSQTGISRKGLEQLIQQCLGMGEIKSLTQISGLSERRRPVFIGGLAIIAALMDELGIEHMSVSSGALREGIAYSLYGESGQELVTERSINKLKAQFDVDQRQVDRVKHQAKNLIKNSDITLNDKDWFLLNAAIEWHELGLSIAHSQFHKHGAYVVQYADLPGFSRQQQLIISQLIRYQRQKISSQSNSLLNNKQWHRFEPMLAILRLSLIYSRDRQQHDIPVQSFTIEPKRLKIPQIWLQHHPLIHADLKEEEPRWLNIGSCFELIPT